MPFYISHVDTKTIKEYETEKKRLIGYGYTITRDYETATHFYKAGAEVVLIKKFINKEVAKNGGA